MKSVFYCTFNAHITFVACSVAAIPASAALSAHSVGIVYKAHSAVRTGKEIIPLASVFIMALKTGVVFSLGAFSAAVIASAAFVVDTHILGSLYKAQSAVLTGKVISPHASFFIMALKTGVILTLGAL